MVKRSRKSTKIAARAGRTIATRQGKAVYFNRELSTVAFNQQVLEQARNEANPLLERVKFLAIVSSNLDEFFEIRVAGLMQQQDSPGGEPSIDGLTPHEQLKRVRAKVNALVKDQYRCWKEQLVPALAHEGLHFKPPAQWNAAEQAWIEDYFRREVLPFVASFGLLAGLALALSCDIRIAAKSAFVTTGYSRVALSGDYGIAWLLTRAVGPGRANLAMRVSEMLTGARGDIAIKIFGSDLNKLNATAEQMVKVLEGIKAALASSRRLNRASSTAAAPPMSARSTRLRPPSRSSRPTDASPTSTTPPRKWRVP